MHIVVEHKRKVILIGLAAVLVAVVLLFLIRKSTDTITDNLNEIITPTPLVIPTIPMGSTLVVSGVTVSNFYPNSREVSPTSDAVLFSNDDYDISYVGAFQKFIITFYNPDFLGMRPQAEQKFLELLSITPEDACRLDAEEAVPLKSDSVYAGGVYRLSFCERE